MNPQSSLQAFCSSWTLTEMRNFPRLINKEEHSSATSVNPPAAILATEPWDCQWPFWVHGIWILQVQTPNWRWTAPEELMQLRHRLLFKRCYVTTGHDGIFQTWCDFARVVWEVQFLGEFPTWIFRETLGHHGLARSGRTIEHGMLKRHSSSLRSSGELQWGFEEVTKGRSSTLGRRRCIC